jgi:peptide/nickel transport system ATP-binding protein
MTQPTSACLQSKHTAEVSAGGPHPPSFGECGNQESPRPPRPICVPILLVLLELESLTVEFPSARGPVAAVRKISLSLAPGETLALVGESGSGKSVTALAIMGLLPPQARLSGAVLFEGRNLATARPAELQSLRGRRMAMIFQEPMTALNPVMRIGDQIAEAVLAHTRNTGGSHMPSFGICGGSENPHSQPLAFSESENKKALTRAQARDRAIEALREVAIPSPERRWRDYPHQLSGGQRQRVMIAMAIVNRPALLIADEPTTALDVTVQAQILALLAELRERLSLAMLFVSHDLAVVRRVSHRVAVMYAGRIVETGAVADLFAHPAHPYTRGLLASIPTLKTNRQQPLSTIEGSVPSPASLPAGCSFAPRCPLVIPACQAAMPALIEVAPGHAARCIRATENTQPT